MDQSATIAFLKSALAREAGRPVESKQTHVSLLFLAGDLVFKLKRAVSFPISTSRRRSCAKNSAAPKSP